MILNRLKTRGKLYVGFTLVLVFMLAYAISVKIGVERSRVNVVFLQHANAAENFYLSSRIYGKAFIETAKEELEMWRREMDSCLAYTDLLKQWARENGDRASRELYAQLYTYAERTKGEFVSLQENIDQRRQLQTQIRQGGLFADGGDRGA